MNIKPLLIVDAMFSWRVANLIRELGCSATHVSALGSTKHDDRLVWKYVEENSATLLTKDSDFLPLLQRSDRGQLVLYVGFNAKQSRILSELAGVLPDALRDIANGQRLVQIP